MVVAWQVLIDSCGALVEEGNPCGFLLLPGWVPSWVFSSCLQLAVSSQLTRRASLYRLISLTYLACLYSSSAIDHDTKPAEDSFSRRTQGPSSE